MEENVMNETVIDEQDVTYDDFVAEQEEAGDGKALKIAAGIGATIIGVAAGVAYKKFGPSVKAKAKEVRIKRLAKRNEKLANKQLAIQTKLNQMQAEKKAEKEE